MGGKKKPCTFSPLERDLESILPVWICIFIVSWSYFFFLPHSIPHRLLGKGTSTKPFPMKGPSEAFTTCSVASQSLPLAERIGRLSIYLHHICDFGVETKHKLTILKHSMCISRWGGFTTVLILNARVAFPVRDARTVLQNVDLSWSQQTMKNI